MYDLERQVGAAPNTVYNSTLMEKPAAAYNKGLNDPLTSTWERGQWFLASSPNGRFKSRQTAGSE